MMGFGMLLGGALALYATPVRYSATAKISIEQEIVCEEPGVLMCEFSAGSFRPTLSDRLIAGIEATVARASNIWVALTNK